MEPTETRAVNVLSELSTIKDDTTETRAVNVLSELSTIKDGHYRNKSSECFE
jgi:hypothetical protein